MAAPRKRKKKSFKELLFYLEMEALLSDDDTDSAIASLKAEGIDIEAMTDNIIKKAKAVQAELATKHASSLLPPPQ